jgi:hypothetical protein
LWGFAKRPTERPASAEFDARYGAQAGRVEIQAGSGTLRANLIATD